MSRGTAACLWVASLVFCATVAAASVPKVTEIRFEGNEVTQETVFLREFALRAGDPADPERIEATRQAILDLGLFREVDVRQEADGDGVALTFIVREKRFILPIPRIAASSDGDYSYGAQLRWNNLWGLDHSFVFFVEQGHHSDRKREREKSTQVSYEAPYAIGEYNLSGSIGYVDRVAPGALGDFDETVARATFTVSRDLRESRPRRGWIPSAGLVWENQDATGTFAPPPDGTITALALGATYDDVRFHVHSESGRRFSVRTEMAHDGLLSDYGDRRIVVRHAEMFALDGGPHRNLNLIAEAGWRSGGPGRVNAFALGGSNELRGYESEFIEGDRYVWFAAEYLRPVHWDWLRLLVVAELGAAGGSVNAAPDGGPFASVGLGVRIRLTWFVNAEFEFGLAYPLKDGDGMRAFAGSG